MAITFVETFKHGLEERRQQAITVPFLDFLMAGGLSIIVMILGTIFVDVEPNLHKVFLASFLFSFALNYPHFMHSYQLLYNGIWGKLLDNKYNIIFRLRHLLAAFIAPAALLGLFAFGFMYPSENLFGYGVNIMFLFSGWHYVKQGYGIMIVLSARRKVFYTEAEKILLLANAYGVWAYTWLRHNSAFNTLEFHNVKYKTFDAFTLIIDAINNRIGTFDMSIDTQPQEVMQTLAYGVMILSFFSAFVLLQKAWSEKQWPAINGLVAYGSALYIWVVYPYSNIYLIYFVPAFHSLQYLLIVWKMKSEQAKEQAREFANKTALAQSEVSRFKQCLIKGKFIIFVITGLASGALFFEAIPRFLDKNIEYDHMLFGPNIFMFMFLIFINVHHYIIDFAIWRKDNPDMRHLFK